MRVQKPKKIKRSALEKTRTVLGEKIRESAVSVLPILVIVVILCLCIVPMRTDLLLTFLIGALLLTVGMGLFSLGAEQSMTLIGSRIGTALTKTKNLPLILGVSFLLGFAITVAEPDLQVLAGTVPHIEKTVLLAVVGAGVGLFMSLCMVRILYGIRLRWVLLVCYAIVFALAAFSAYRTSEATAAQRPTASVSWRSAPSGRSSRCSFSGSFTATAPALRSSRRYPTRARP